MEISLVREKDLKQLSQMIQETCKTSFCGYYPKNWIDYTINRQTINRLREKSKLLHFYVAKEDEKIIGCAAIGDYYGKQDESCLFSFFVDPNYQGKGIGKSLIKHLEKDQYFTRANKIFVPSSIPALPFYKKMGYDFVDEKMIFDDGSFLLVKIKK